MSRSIALLSQSLDIGGTERQLAEVAIALDRGGYRAVAVCFDGRGMRADQLRRAGIPVEEFPVRSFRSPATLATAAAFYRWLRATAVDVVHTFDVPTAVFAVPIARAARVPVVLSSQRGDRRLFSPALQRALRFTDRLSDAVVVNSEYVRGILVDEYGVPARKIATCSNGIDLDLFSPCGPSHRAALPAGRLIVGVVAALRPEKSIETLIDAVARMERAADVHLVVVGDGPCKEALRDRAAAAGLEPACTFVPATPAVADWYRSLDVFVLPSLNESFSNSLMEAMACRCTVIASNVGGNPELVRDGDNGLLFEPGHSEDLARRLERVLEDDWLRTRLAGAAADTIRDGYGIAKSTQRFADLYQAWLGGVGPA